jgi:hypothetical protein
VVVSPLFYRASSSLFVRFPGLFTKTCYSAGHSSASLGSDHHLQKFEAILAVFDTVAAIVALIWQS